MDRGRFCMWCDFVRLSCVGLPFGTHVVLALGLSSLRM